MNALVTGANGFVGTNLVRCLLHYGHRVRAFVRATSDRRSLDGLDVDTVFGDILDVHTLIRAARGCDIIFHTAALFSYSQHSSDRLMTIAREGTKNVLVAAKERNVPRVVLTSSSVVFGSTRDPICLNEKQRVPEPDPSPYIASKIDQETTAFELADDLGIEMIAACPTVCTGPNDYGLSESNAIIIHYLQDPLKATWPGGCNIVSAQDVALGHLLIAERGEPGHSYLMGSENLTWSDIHRLISDICGVPGPLIIAGHTACYLAGAYHEAVSFFSGKRPLVNRVQAKMVGRYYWYDHSRIRTLGYAPEPARMALASAISWLAQSEHVTDALRNSMTLSKEAYDQRR